MAWTVTKLLTQRGKFVSFEGKCVTDATPATAALFDFSADVTATVDGVTYTAAGIRQLVITPLLGLLSTGMYNIEFLATTPRIICMIPRYGPLVVDFTKTAMGMLLNAKESGWNGDITVRATSSAVANDAFGIFMELELQK